MTYAKCFLMAFLNLALLTLSCATEKLNEGSELVEVVGTLPKTNCKELGSVEGKGGGVVGGAWLPYRKLNIYALNDLRNNAASMGATHVLIPGYEKGKHLGGPFTSTVKRSGTAYKCP